MSMTTEQGNPDIEAIKSPAISVVIVNWNGLHVLGDCLDALDQQTYNNFEVILVDNASSDGSVEFLREKWPEVQIIELQKNLGFAAANNIAVKHARGDWVALLNNDAFPEPEWLEVLAQMVDRYPQAGSFASRLINHRDPKLLDGAGDVYHISGVAWRRKYNQIDRENGKPVEEVFSACAAAGLYSKQVYLEMGGFDEDYFSYQEDIDLGFRMRLAGFPCYYVPSAVVEHVGSSSTGVRSDFSVYYGHRNLVWTYFKNMPGWLLWAGIIPHVLMTIVFLAVFTLRGQGKPIWKAKIDALLDLPDAWRKRQQIQKRRKVKSSEIWSIIDKGWVRPFILEYRSRNQPGSIQGGEYVDR